MSLAAARPAGAARPGLLWAEAIGARVPRAACEGGVEAVFERASLVYLDTGRRMVVLSGRAGNVAHGIRLKQDLRFDAWLRPGMSVRIGAGRVFIGGGAMNIRLSGAREWSAGLRPGRCDWQAGTRLAAIRARELFRPEAERRGSEFLACVLQLPASGTPLGSRIAAILPALAFAARSANREAARRLIARLVGLGPGLTPAGDDFLVGWLAGLVLQASSPARLAFLDAMREAILVLAEATASASREHLADACAFEFSERLAALCLAISDGEPPTVLSSSVAAQAGVGASSGADAAAGLLFALFDCGLAAPAG